MLLDPETWTLAQRADRLLAVVGDDLAGSCSAETHEAALELTTAPMPRSAGRSPSSAGCGGGWPATRGTLGLAAAVAGMHPGEMAEDPQVSPAGRYQVVQRTMRGIARREPTFALHVHIGVADPESAIRLLNRLRAHLPLLLALSASSPLWRGRATGLASNRTILFQAFPRTGLPRHFENYDDWVATVDLLLRCKAIPEPTFLWWDARPQPRFGTIEVRIMDAQPRLQATAALCALVQAAADWNSKKATPRPSSHTPRKHSPRTASSPPATASTPNSSTPPAPSAYHSPTCSPTSLPQPHHTPRPWTQPTNSPPSPHSSQHPKSPAKKHAPPVPASPPS